MNASLVDVGVNLGDESFAKDRNEVIERALDAGVHTMVLTGSSVATSRQVAKLAQTRRGTLYATAGIHPHHAQSASKDFYHDLVQILQGPEVVAVGECGLDFYRDLSPRLTQQACFEKQLALAIELGRPLFIHERDAASEMLSILRAHEKALPRAVIHCFTGNRETLDHYLDLGLYIGITGWICDERRGLHLRDLVGLIPENRLMIESDAPYLLPRTMPRKPRSRRNEPAFLPYVVARVAESLGVSLTEVALRTTQTAKEFFALP